MCFIFLCCFLCFVLAFAELDVGYLSNIKQGFDFLRKGQQATNARCTTNDVILVLICAMNG